jgi:serine/threonine protein kinase
VTDTPLGETELTGLDVEDELGRGAFTTVHRARRDGVAYALKRPLPDAAADPALAAAFQREAALLACVNDPGVGRIHAAGRFGDAPALVLEYLPGGSLADQLAAGPMAPERVVELAAQLARGLAAAHRVGLVHRDVKPQNLLLRRDGMLEIADFGIARAAETTRLTLAGTVLGTAAYLAPEQALGEDVGPAADLYSLGAVLYELLTGEPPFRFETLAQVAAERPQVCPVRELAPAVPQALEDVVMGCLARNPSYRPSSAAKLGAALAAAVPDLPTERLGLPDAPTERTLLRTRIAPAPPRPAARGRWARPRWIAVTLAVLLGVAAVALAVALASHDGTAKPRRPAAPRIVPVPRGSTPAAEARNLAAWIGRYSRAG